MKKNIIYIIVFIIISVGIIITINSINNSHIENENAELKPIKLPKVLCFIREKDPFSKLQVIDLDSFEMRYLGKFTVDYINIDTFPQFIDSFALKYTPTIIVCDTMDSVLIKMEGRKDIPYLEYKFKKLGLIK